MSPPLPSPPLTCLLPSPLLPFPDSSPPLLPQAVCSLSSAHNEVASFVERLLPFHQLSVQREMALPSSGQKLQEKNMALLAALPSLPSALGSISSYLAVLASEGWSTCTHTEYALLLFVYCPSLPSPPLPSTPLPFPPLPSHSLPSPPLPSPPPSILFPPLPSPRWLSRGLPCCTPAV